MKGKIIALLTATVCIGSMFAACGNEESSTCPGHVDADKNKYCDNCNSEIVYLTEKLPAEEEPVVDMVVNPIPDKETNISKNGEFLNTKVDYVDEITGTATLFDKYKAATFEDQEDTEKVVSKTQSVRIQNLGSGNCLVTKTTETVVDYVDTMLANEVSYVVEYILYDIVEDKELFTKTVSFTKEERDDAKQEVYTISTYGRVFFTVTVKTFDEDASNIYEKVYNYNYELYSYDGTKLDSSIEEAFDIRELTGLNNGERNFMINGVRYIVDAETNAIVKKYAKDAYFFDRPEFDAVFGDNGYVYEDGRVYVFNLKSEDWVDCVYTYDVPSYMEDVRVFYMNNGNVLIQSTTAAKSDVNYDVLVNNAKKDIVYTVIDLSGETIAVKDVEFGYYIQDLRVIEGEELAKEGENSVVACMIVDKKIDANAPLFLTVDKDLNVTWKFETTIMGQMAGVVGKLSEGYYIVTVKYDANTSREAVVDINGKLVNWIPKDAVKENGLFKIGEKFYDLTANPMKLVIDLEEYDRVDNYGDYYILQKDVYEELPEDSTEVPELLGTNYYRWSCVDQTPAKIIDYTKNEYDEESGDAIKTYTLQAHTDNYYTIKVWEKSAVEGEDDKVSYVTYNAVGGILATTDSAISNVDASLYNFDVYVITLENGNVWVLRPAA